MAITNSERVGNAMNLLQKGLFPFVEREFKSVYKEQARSQAMAFLGDDRLLADKPMSQWDVAALLRVMWEAWNEIFRRTLGHAERSLVSELRDARNRWAHQQSFSGDDAYRVLDSSSRLLTAISASESQEMERAKMELLRVRFDEQARSEKRKNTGSVVEGATTTGLKPWREVVTPHKDVASGRYQQAEFAADLWQVYLGEGSDEYLKPVEFFRRTFLTESLKRLLVSAVRRICGQGGDPVVQLQTNFGGGKTHSMLALLHLFSGTDPRLLPGVESVMQDVGVSSLPKVNPVVLVGNKISPGNPLTKFDGTVVRTLWGELAWQLGGREAYELIRADDERATNPGDRLRELFNACSPSLILIDEWVAYARQLHDQGDLPGGSFETQFSFAQALTESAKLAKDCLLIVSLPASDGSSNADNVEVGGQRGREALDRLRNVVGRVESSWRPASAEEGFEIVRRRLFEPLIEREHYVSRDRVAETFYDLYRSQQQEFPPECRSSDYEGRIKAAYPIHPEVFDRLYNDWSTLAKFQRTRGVLRLMAAVIHCLWEKGDRNPLILPSHIPIDDPRVQFELTRYLSDNWTPVIEKDVDGPNSLPLRLDGEVPNLGKLHACRRVARTIYMGSAPTANASNRGLEDRRIKLGCVMPGESPSVFGDALRRLAGAATYLYQDGPHYWYDTQPTVTKLAEDRAEQFKRDPDRVASELEKRLRDDLRQSGDFSRIHPVPRSMNDVPDDLDARLVVLSAETPHSKEPNSPAEIFAQSILDSRGNADRHFRNSLVFLAVDKTRLTDLDDALRRFLAWESIVNDKDALNLAPNQVKQAETQRKSADSVVTARLPEAYCWLLVPVQETPQLKVTWQAMRLSGQDALAVRVSKKLRNDEMLITSLAGTRLRMELDRIPLWRGDHVSIRTLVEDFAQYIYLPRLKNSDVLCKAINDGLTLLMWEYETFAYADGFDDASQSYQGLRTGQTPGISADNQSGLLVKSDVARKQRDKEQAVSKQNNIQINITDDERVKDGRNTKESTTDAPPKGSQPKRYHGSVTLDSTRVGRDAARIADEVIAHLSGLVGATVTVTLEIDAEIPGGTPNNVVRTVTENSRTLKFTSHGFEEH